MEIKKEDKKKLEELYNKANKILKEIDLKAGNSGWSRLILDNLPKNILKKDFKECNKNYIWFKEIKHLSKEYNEIYNIVCEMVSIIKLKECKHLITDFKRINIQYPGKLDYKDKDRIQIIVEKVCEKCGEKLGKELHVFKFSHSEICPSTIKRSGEFVVATEIK